jgi:hypothetical protein
MFVGKKTYRPKVQSWYGCSYHVQRGDAICNNGVYAPVDALDAALLDGVEKAVLDPVALRYVLDKAAADVRRTLGEDPRKIQTLQKRRAEVQRKITRLVAAIAEEFLAGKVFRITLGQICMNFTPHSEQNFLPSRFSAWHLGHFISHLRMS